METSVLSTGSSGGKGFPLLPVNSVALWQRLADLLEELLKTPTVCVPVQVSLGSVINTKVVWDISSLEEALMSS